MKKLFKKVFSPPTLRLNSAVIFEVVFILTVLLAVMFYYAHKVLRQESMNCAEETLQSTVLHADNVLRNVEQASGNIYWDLMGHLDQPDRMATYCRSMVESNPNIMGCVIAFKPGYYPDRDSSMTYVTRRKYDSQELLTMETIGAMPYTEQKWYVEPMENGRSGWFEPMKNEEVEDETVITYCLPIYAGRVERGERREERGEPVGVMAVGVSIKLLSKIVLSAKPTPNSFSILLGKDGSFIVHPDPKVLAEHSLSTLKAIGADPAMIEAGEAMLAGETGYKLFKMNGENMYIFYKPFMRSNVRGRVMGNLDWSIAVVYPEKDIFGEYFILMKHVVKVTLFGVLLFFLLSRFIIRSQLKPVRSLTESVQRIAEGDYSEKLPDTHRSDEIGLFQQHFKLMQQSLANHVEELGQLKATLDKQHETLHQTYEKAQEADRAKVNFLHHVTHQLIPTSEAILGSVNKLCDNYQTIGLKEADHEIDIIKHQSEETLELLNGMLNASGRKTEKEVSHE